ncbi:MAG: GNAT family N-acetyltransferase [Gammaproteobacteria bacterium]|nr:GNAT family N-acetyltransferase [Gammaproteobacteria bacterium]
MEAESYLDDIEFEFSLKPSKDPEFSHYLLHFSGKATGWDDDANDEIIIGEISGHRLDLSAARAAKVNFQDFLESVSSEVADLGDSVFHGQSTCMLDASVKDKIQKAECDCIIYIDTLLVNPAHRGKRIGTTLLRRLSEMIDMENGLIALKAYPIPDDPDAVIDDVEPKTPAEIEKVKKFYEHLGFERVEDDYMIKDARTCLSKKHKTK